jgi:hypothetical protein
MCSSELEPTGYSLEENIASGPVSKCNFFAISLFTRVTDHGIQYSCPVNFRSAMTELFTRKEDSRLSLVEQVHKGKRGIFSTNPILVSLYEECNLGLMEPEDEKDSEPMFMRSMAKETLVVSRDGTTIKDVLVKLKRYGLFPSQDQWLKVAYILNVKISKAIVQPEMPDLLDVKRVIEHLKVVPQSNSDLEEFVRDTLDWPFFELHEETKTVYENLWRIRTFFQAMQPVGMSFIEGNHRAVLASKMLYGQDVAEPLPMKHPFPVYMRDSNGRFLTHATGEKMPSKKKTAT